jgi:hypothetical protein
LLPNKLNIAQKRLWPTVNTNQSILPITHGWLTVSMETAGRWSIAICSLKRWMAVGICKPEQAVSHNFQMWRWRSIGHGHYCFESDGFVFSHSDAAVNYQLKSFPFKNDDELHF